MIISWNTTNACNMMCKHCYRDAGVKAEQELSTEEGLKLIDQIAEVGFKIMIFSGGEPLMRKDIYTLVNHAREKGLRPVFGTNGTLLTAEVAKRLKDAGAAAMGISLDSIDHMIHDMFRGVYGSWQKAVDGMRACREIGLPFQIHTTVMDWNMAEVEDLTDFAVEEGAIAHHIFFLVPTGRVVNIEKETLRAEQYEELLRRIMKKQSEVKIELKPTCAPQFMRIASEMGLETRFNKGCLAGLSYCIISPLGIVQPCAYLNIPAGNVREKPFGEIWREAEIFKVLRTEEYKGACGSCRYKKYAAAAGPVPIFTRVTTWVRSHGACTRAERNRSHAVRCRGQKTSEHDSKGLSPGSEPYRELGVALGVPEEEVLARLQALMESGVIRRLGGVFDSRKLGYSGALCAMNVDKERIREVAGVVNSFTGVTHNYLREGFFNMWFTVLAPTGAKLGEILDEIRERTGIREILTLPSENIFKIRVNFDLD